MAPRPALSLCKSAYPATPLCGAGDTLPFFMGVFSNCTQVTREPLLAQLSSTPSRLSAALLMVLSHFFRDRHLLNLNIGADYRHLIASTSTCMTPSRVWNNARPAAIARLSGRRQRSCVDVATLSWAFLESNLKNLSAEIKMLEPEATLPLKLLFLIRLMWVQNRFHCQPCTSQPTG